jgi:hypothetical protein
VPGVSAVALPFGVALAVTEDVARRVSVASGVLDCTVVVVAGGPSVGVAVGGTPGAAVGVGVGVSSDVGVGASSDVGVGASSGVGVGSTPASRTGVGVGRGLQPMAMRAVPARLR